MKQRFLVAIDSPNDTLDQEIRKLFEDQGLGWWHWIDGFWLLTSHNSDVTAATIRDGIGEISKNRVLVMEIDKYTSWAGRGPQTEENNMFNWIYNTWKPD